MYTRSYGLFWWVLVGWERRLKAAEGLYTVLEMAKN